MGATLRNTLLVCLLAAAAQCPAQTSSPYHGKFQSLTAKWPASTSYEKLSLLDQIYRLRHLLGDHRAVKQAIEQLASQTENVDVKTEAAAFLADLRDEAGEANVLGPQHWYQTGRKQDVLIELRRQAKSGG